VRAPGHRSSLVVALAVGASLFAACGGGSDDAASTPVAPSTPSSSRPAGTATPSTSDSSCPPARGAPAGPSAEAQVIQEGEGSAPRIEAAVYPAPEGGGEPWSQWGQGVVLPDGRFLSTAGDHRGADGNAYLFVYDPETRRITRVADVLSQVEHEEGAWGYGKIHAQLVASGCDVYLATYWGSRRGLEFSPSYDGDLLFRVDPSTLELEPLGTPVPRHGVPSLAGSTAAGLLYGEAVDPLVSERRDTGSFFAYDVEAGRVTFESDNPDHIGFRNIAVGPDGTAYLAGEGGVLLAYEPGSDELRPLPDPLPGGGWLRASTAPGPDGTVYGVTQDPDRLFALHRDGRITDLGEARGYTASLALSPDGSRFFYVPGAHGDAYEQGTPLIAVDTETGDQTVVAELNPPAERELGLRLGGTYDVAVDPSGDRVYVGLNAAEPSAEDAFGEVVLAVVHL
jgi:hypothetical protein